MRKFEEAIPETIDSDNRVIFKIVDKTDGKNPKSFKFLLIDKKHLIWATKSLFPAIDEDPAYWLAGNIIEFPVSGLQWFIDTLEQKFFKTEDEGGLPKDQFTFDEIVDGEHLCVSRMFGTPGYGFRNYSRQDHLWEEGDEDEPQQADLSDELLFEKGLFEKFKEVANQLALSSTKP